jgi:hypothetical protein
MHRMTIFPRVNNGRAWYMFQGHVFQTQEARKRTERKFRDWEGWLELVAAYHKEALLHGDSLVTNRPDSFN